MKFRLIIIDHDNGYYDIRRWLSDQSDLNDKGIDETFAKHYCTLVLDKVHG